MPGLISVPGAATPSEMAEAYSYGADLVKLFPAGDLGIGYMKSGLAPLNGPCSRLFIRGLHSGHLLLINHHDFKGSNNLSAML